MNDDDDDDVSIFSGAIEETNQSKFKGIMNGIW